MTIIFLDSTQKVRKVCNNSDFSQKQYFSGYVFKVSAWLSNHTVCKIGLKFTVHKNKKITKNTFSHFFLQRKLCCVV
jgi:hypothetical protein